MARPLRLELVDGVYHVTARGNAKEEVFTDRHDYAAFLGIFRHTCTRQAWSCLGYCLMPNHYHLILRTPRPNLSRGMHQVNGVYAQRFNRRHARPGHVWQGRFASALVQADKHLFEALRYVALNPVRAGLCLAPEEWPWSSHSAVIGSRSSSIVNVPEVLGLFDSSVAAARTAYAGLVAEASPSGDDPAPPVYGDDDSRREVMNGVAASSEVPVRERHASRPRLEAVLDGADRDLAMLEAYREHGYRMNEIANALGCHYSTVSRRLRAAEARQEMRVCKT